MKVKSLLLGLLVVASSFSASALNIKFEKATANQIEYSYDEETGIYTFKTLDGGDPNIQTKPNGVVLGDATTLSFDYKCETGLEFLEIFYSPIAGGRSIDYRNVIEKTSEWKHATIDISEPRQALNWGNEVGNNMRWDLGTAAGAIIQIKNVQIEGVEDPKPEDTEYKVGTTMYLEAENYKANLIDGQPTYDGSDGVTYFYRSGDPSYLNGENGKNDRSGALCRVDCRNASIQANGHGGFSIADMGVDWNAYSFQNYISDDDVLITKEMAIKNWGAWYTYTIDVKEDITANINVLAGTHFLSWGTIAAVGLEPGVDEGYIIEGNEGLNWTKTYSGAMVLEIDGKNVPSNQKSHLKAIAGESSDEYTARAADPNNWASTLVNGQANDTVWVYPNPAFPMSWECYTHETPDWVVNLTKGKHEIKLTGLASQFVFDALVFKNTAPSAVENVAAKADAFNAYAANGTIYATAPAKVYNLAGALVGTANNTLNVAAGVYVVKAGSKAVKVLVK